MPGHCEQDPEETIYVAGGRLQRKWSFSRVGSRRTGGSFGLDKQSWLVFSEVFEFFADNF
jgi:hypothetical protein